DERTGLGLALATDGNGRYSRLDPYAGAQLALAEAYRNVAAIGARPAAVTNCLNFGSPEDPGVMWQFAETVRGLAHGRAFLGPPGTRGHRTFSQPAGGGPHPPPAGGGRAGGPARRAAPAPARLPPARGCRGTARPDRPRFRRFGVGLGGPRPPRRAPARRGSARRAGTPHRPPGRRGPRAAPARAPTLP